MVEGDRVFLMHLGDEHRCIVASGRVEHHDPLREGPAVQAGSDVYVEELQSGWVRIEGTGLVRVHRAQSYPHSDQDTLHGRHSSVLHVPQHLRVGVHRLGYRGVSQHLLHHLRVLSLRQQGRGARVPEVVDRYPGSSSPFQERLRGEVRVGVRLVSIGP